MGQVTEKWYRSKKIYFFKFHFFHTLSQSVHVFSLWHTSKVTICGSDSTKGSLTSFWIKSSVPEISAVVEGVYLFHRPDGYFRIIEVLPFLKLVLKLIWQVVVYEIVIVLLLFHNLVLGIYFRQIFVNLILFAAKDVLITFEVAVTSQV